MKGLRSCNGLTTQTSEQQATEVENLKSLVYTWFSSGRSSEEMTKGTANETAVLAAFSSQEFTSTIFECGMLKANRRWLVCSPDGVAIIDKKFLRNFGLPDAGLEGAGVDQTRNRFTLLLRKSRLMSRSQL